MESTRGYHLGQVKERLIEKVLEHLGRGERIQDLSLRQIAREIGISSAAPYRHFPTTNDLISAVASRGFENLSLAFEACEPRNLPNLGKMYVEFGWNNPQLYRTMFYFPAAELSAYPQLAKAAERSYKMLEKAVSETLGEKNQTNAAVASWAFVHGWADLGVQNLISPKSLGEESLRLSLEVFVEGLKNGSKPG